MCPGIFGKDPERYLKEERLAFPDPVRPGQAAVVDSTHRVQLNYEVFYFRDVGTRRRFLADPTRYCGLLTDPVTSRRFQPTARSPRADYGGRRYFFTDSASLVAFLAMPDSLALRKGP